MGQGQGSRQERRRASRFDKVFPVYLVSPDGIGRGIARNISSGGMYIETRDPLPLGGEVSVRFVDDRFGVEISANSEVRHHLLLEFSQPLGEERKLSALRGMGVRFVEFLPRGEPSLVAPAPLLPH